MGGSPFSQHPSPEQQETTRQPAKMPKTCYYVSETIEENAPETKYVWIAFPGEPDGEVRCYLSLEDALDDQRLNNGIGIVLPYAKRSAVVEVQTRFGKVYHKKTQRKSK